jgi:hypothetical protein
MTHGHGAGVRGIDVVPRSTLFQGRFGRMFRSLRPARFEDRDLRALGSAMVAPPDDPPTPEDQVDDEENPGIDAGYTYLGQFIDHDLTFDPASSLQRFDDPDALTDFRTPRFDLDCLYGRGPDDQPYLYEPDGVRMQLGEAIGGNPADPGARDLPRNVPDPGMAARALVGDPRNDENRIVAQLHATMLRFHNRVADVLRRRGAAAPDFQEVAQAVRWHYQWVVLHDFVPTIVGDDMLRAVLPHLTEGTTVLQSAPDLRFYHPHEQPYIPIEFTVAAYRFGHSMVRPIYRLNRTLERQPIFAPGQRFDLTGFRPIPDGWAIDWGFFFDLDRAGEPTPQGRPQKAYKIDTSLVNALGNLPASVATGESSLATRNLLRGWRMELPSGQDVARAMGVPPIPDERLRVRKAIQGERGQPLTDVAARFAGNAPLWYYLLAEAQQPYEDPATPTATPVRLGPVGGRIVTEVFVGLLLGDPNSFLSKDPTWQPLPELAVDGRFGIVELLAAATVPQLSAALAR